MKNLLTLLIALLSLAGLSGCVSTDERYNAQGNMVYEVSCRFRSVDTCLEEAGRTCGILGYKEVQKDGSPLPPPEAVKPQPEPQPQQPWQGPPPQQQGPSLKERIGYDRKIYVKCGHTYQPDP